MKLNEKRAVVLLSGGLDSATTLAIACSEGYTCHALSVDYGQRHSAELEAAARVAMALGASEHRVVDVDLGQFGGSALPAPAIDVPMPMVTVPEIQHVVSKYFGIKLSDLQGKRRSKAISLPRQVAVYLTRMLTSHSLEEIGSLFGGKDHTTIIYAVEKIRGKVDSDDQFKATVDLLADEVRRRRHSS